MKRILLDQGLPSFAAELLRRLGWDAVHVREIGMRDATDKEILARAVADGRICVTLDKDFHEALAQSQAEYPSVILLRWQNLRAEGVADVVQATVTRYETGVAFGGCNYGERARNTGSETATGPIPASREFSGKTLAADGRG